MTEHQEAAGRLEPSIYTASKTAHAYLWRQWRSSGEPILSTWIDEAGAGETACFVDLWDRCIGEASRAACTILYRETGETLKGALVEAGAALAAGRTVLFVGDKDGLGSFLNHRHVEECADLSRAFERAHEIIRRPLPASTSEGEWVTVPRQRFAAAISTLLDAAKDAGIGSLEFAREMGAYLSAAPASPGVEVEAVEGVAAKVGVRVTATGWYRFTPSQLREFADLLRAPAISTLTAPTAPGGEWVTDADRAWLERQKDNGHCGEGTFERHERERHNDRIDRILSALSAAPVRTGGDFQDRVQPWMLECFGAEIAADREERGDRLLEEVFELLQSGGYDQARVIALRDYVWGRPVGEPSQEVGGVMVTLAAYCLAHGLDMHAAGKTELARISAPEIVAKIRAKQAAKPTGSALPVAVRTGVEVEEVARIIDPWAFRQCEWAIAQDDDAILRDYLPAREAALTKARQVLALADKGSGGEERASVANRAPTGDPCPVLTSAQCKSEGEG